MQMQAKTVQQTSAWPMSFKRLWIALACLWILAAGLGPDVSVAGPFRLRPEDFVTAIMVFLAILLGRGRLQSPRLLQLMVGVATAFVIIGTVAVAAGVLADTTLATEGTFGFGAIE